MIKNNSKKKSKGLIKSLTIIIVTFLIGIILGFLISGRIVKKRIKHFRRFNTEEGFKERCYSILKLNKIQKNRSKHIINKYAEKNKKLNHNFHITRKAMIDSFTQELLPILTEEQKVKFKKMHKHRHKKPPKH